MTAKSIGRFYVILNAINDTAYFGFLAIQLFLLVSSGILSVWQTLILITSQLLWQVLAEGPTGALADIYGRAWAVAASFWCRLLGIVLVAASYIAHLGSKPSPIAKIIIAVALILAQVLIATGEAFLEGSIQAWLRDECAAADPKNFEYIVGKSFEYSAIVQNIAILIVQPTFIKVWKISIGAKIILLLSLACLNLVGALISHWLFAREKFLSKTTGDVEFAKNPISKFRRIKLAILSKLRGAFTVSALRQTKAAILSKLRGAFSAVSRTGERSIRWLIIALVLPFPCWVLLSWFFTAFVKLGGSADANSLQADFIVYLSLTLGVARVLGAWVGKILSSQGDEKLLRLLLEKAVFINVCFLFCAALLLMLRCFDWISSSTSVVALLFFPVVAVAKGSEEVVKLSTNKILIALPDSNIRATTLSLVSVAQNAFGFIAIFLCSLLAVMVTGEDDQQAIIIFAVCAVFGVTGWLIRRNYHSNHQAQAAMK